MPVSPAQKQIILTMLSDGADRNTIAAAAGVSPGQVSAIAAHVTMGTYGGRRRHLVAPDSDVGDACIPGPSFDGADGSFAQLPSDESDGLLIGSDASTGEIVRWNPFPEGGSPNPHVLVVGESGSGKTYTVQCLLLELAKRGIPAIVFDYGQGFARSQLPADFSRAAHVVEVAVSASGIALNPLEIFPFDHHGPLNVAQRLADTFARIYKIGVQQHAVLRAAVMETMATAGITAEDRKSWSRPLPSFRRLREVLDGLAAEQSNPQRRYAASVSAHISSVFVFDLFRQDGRALQWPEFIQSNAGIHVIQLRGLEASLERVVTELLLWNLVGYVEALGPGALRSFVVLDEAHRLPFDPGSATERLLREGRKFGLGLIFASQQADDFSETAIANTATKLVFQIGDRQSTFAKRLSGKIKGSNVRQVSDSIQRLPRQHALYVHQNTGRIVRITSLEDRLSNKPLAG